MYVWYPDIERVKIVKTTSALCPTHPLRHTKETDQTELYIDADTKDARDATFKTWSFFPSLEQQAAKNLGAQIIPLSFSFFFSYFRSNEYFKHFVRRVVKKHV